MKQLSCLVLLFISMAAFSQKSYRVTYESKREYTVPFTINGQVRTGVSKSYYDVIFNDSICYSFVSNEDRKKINRKLSDHLHHGNYFIPKKNLYFNIVAYPDPKDPLLIRDTITRKQVYIDSTIKRFKDWRCKEGYTVLNSTDTIFVLLAIDYPYPYGPITYFGFPYLPLEIYDTRHDFHILAKRIEEWDREIIFPSDIPVVSHEEWRRRKGF